MIVAASAVVVIATSALNGKYCGIPHLAKNERDVGHSDFVVRKESKRLRSLVIGRQMARALRRNLESACGLKETADLSGALPRISCWYWWPESSEDHLPTNILGVLRLRAIDPL
jgi:hypothetical protein